MAIQNWDVTRYLSTTNMPLTAYPFFLHGWVRRASTLGERAIISLENTGDNHIKGLLRLEADNAVGAAMATTTDSDLAFTTAASASGAWFSAAGAFVATNSREVWLNGASKGINTFSAAPTNPTRVIIGTNVYDNVFGATDGVAEISVWDITGLTSGQRDTLAANLASGDNPRNVNALSPYTGLLRAYWPLLNTTDLNDASGNGKHLTMTGSLTNFASHPTIDAVVSSGLKGKLAGQGGLVGGGRGLVA